MKDQKAKLATFTNASVRASSKNVSALSENSIIITLEQRKKQAEEPIYLNRM